MSPMDASMWHDNVQDALCHQRCHCGAIGPWLIPHCCFGCSSSVKELFHKAFHPLKVVAPMASGEWSWHDMGNGPGMTSASEQEILQLQRRVHPTHGPEPTATWGDSARAEFNLCTMLCPGRSCQRQLPKQN